MRISKKELEEMNACGPGLRRFIKQTKGTDAPVEVSSLIGGENTLGDLVWLACEKLKRERVVELARDCALINIELIKPHTDKYEKILSVMKNPHTKEAGKEVIMACNDIRDKAYSRYAVHSSANDVAVYAAASSVVHSVTAAVRMHKLTHISHVGSVGYAVGDAVNAASQVGEESVTEIEELLKEMFTEEGEW